MAWAMTILPVNKVWWLEAIARSECVVAGDKVEYEVQPFAGQME